MRLDLQFTSQGRLDGAGQIMSRRPSKADLVVSHYVMNRPGHGIASPDQPTDAHLAVVHLRSCGAHDQWRDGTHIRRAPQQTGGLALFDLRQSWNSDLRDPFHTVNFHIPRWVFDDLADELNAPRIDIPATPPENDTDEIMMHLTRALLPALARPWEVSTLFVEHIFAAVRLHLAGTYGGLRPRTRPPRGGLASWQEQRAKELLMQSLRGDVTVADLAVACGLSGSHFLRAFKQTTGATPHRWLLEHRVATARQLLEDPTRDLADIAQACGFADQSHFTRVFSKSVGISPGAWRRLRTSRAISR